jgi:type II secretory pathway pseudopilin PulG
MLARLRDESGMGLVELTIAMFMLTIALLALAAGYDSAAISVHNADKKTVAAKLAASQIELYQSLKVSNIGLDSTNLSNVNTTGRGGYDATYVSDEAGLTPTGTDHTISCSDPTAPQCAPIQNVAGPENHQYRVETFVRDVANTGATGTWNERYVTVIVRDRGATGNPLLFSETSAFDPGPA